LAALGENRRNLLVHHVLQHAKIRLNAQGCQADARKPAEQVGWSNSEFGPKQLCAKTTGMIAYSRNLLHTSGPIDDRRGSRNLK
jgi:hypothetical protein